MAIVISDEARKMGVELATQIDKQKFYSPFTLVFIIIFIITMYFSLWQERNNELIDNFYVYIAGFLSIILATSHSSWVQIMNQDSSKLRIIIETFLVFFTMAKNHQSFKTPQISFEYNKETDEICFLSNGCNRIEINIPEINPRNYDFYYYDCISNRLVCLIKSGEAQKLPLYHFYLAKKTLLKAVSILPLKDIEKEAP